MEALLNLEWKNQHSVQEFPFIGSSPYFPDGIFVDLSVLAYNSESIYLSSLLINQIDISGELTTSSGEIMSFSEPIQESQNGYAQVISSDGRVRGTIAFGDDSPNLIRSIGTKSITMSEDVKVSPSCLIGLHPKQVSSIVLNNQKYSGTIKLKGDEGVFISGTGNDVQINATGKIVVNPCCEEYYPPLKAIEVLKNGESSLVVPVNGGIIIRSSDSGQPHSVSDERQLIRVSSMKNGVSIYLAN